MMTSSESVSLADAIFPRTKQRVLAILYGQPTRSFYANEIVELAASGTGATRRELSALTNSGLVTAKRVGNQMHYQANSDSPIFSELCAIVQKTIGLAEPLREALGPFTSQITAAFVYGSVAKNSDTAHSDIDLLVVSDVVSYGELFSVLEAASMQLGRQVNPTILSKKEFEARVSRQESFLTRVIAQPKIWIIGKADDLGI